LGGSFFFIDGRTGISDAVLSMGAPKSSEAHHQLEGRTAGLMLLFSLLLSAFIAW